MISDTLRTLHATAISLAGADNRWDNVNAPSGLRTDHVKGLRSLLAKSQGNVCVGCGMTLINVRIELCHIVPSRVSGGNRGIMPGNVYAGCRECNELDNELFATYPTLESFVRPDLIAIAFPSRQECLAETRALASRKDVARAARLALAAPSV